MSSSVPVSLGKPSLRRRLEAYYSLIAPDQVANEPVWLGKFQQIYAKYGGSHDGERKLARKLEVKYGSEVRLLLASSVEQSIAVVVEEIPDQQRSEAWYTLTEKETNSGIIGFCSPQFDPVAALKAPEDDAKQANPCLKDCHRMDRIDQVRSLLPKDDPLYRSAVRKAQTSAKKISQQEEDKQASDSKKVPSLFAPLVENLDKGPFVVLYNALVHRKRVRVVTRYVNGIRGTLTGHLIAFDKHMNLLMRDIVEVYSLRHTERNYSTSNLEQEVARRQQPVRQRHMRHMMVRGDNVILVYLAESERSAYPRTSKSPKGSIYKERKTYDKSKPHHLGTVGSLLFAQQRQKQGKKSYSSK